MSGGKECPLLEAHQLEVQLAAGQPGSKSKSSDDLHLCLRPSLLILLAPRREQVFAGRRMRSLNSKWRTRFSADADTGHVATQSGAQGPRARHRKLRQRALKGPRLKKERERGKDGEREGKNDRVGRESNLFSHLTYVCS